MVAACKAEEWGVAVATSIDAGAADGNIDKYKVGVFKNDYTSILRAAFCDFFLRFTEAEYNYR